MACPTNGRNHRQSGAGNWQREQGQVAHSPELTAAAGWLVAIVVLGMVGEKLTRGLTELVSGSLTWSGAIVAEPAAVVSHVRGLVLGLGWPLVAILAGFVVGALAAHQLQVRGLCATVLIVPTPARLWRSGAGRGCPSGLRAQPGRWQRGPCFWLYPPGRSARDGARY